ncbi:sensor histidine kinase [Cryptosporangium arvum]|uniref:histidine kinase n=1 Tax=Cryptosporangium arvum DSM 44712 TaxID=927661 RepID=A0A010Z0Z2_9ACTN|nr:histidine kinase [Cryptosporangium arvum]EXG81108.1 signal transduction histidine kinase [Cryptosporangium arvum DSM 44712]
MTPPRYVAPLISGTTYRRGVHLLLGAVIALPYLVLARAVLTLGDDRATRPALLLTGVAAAAIAAAPAFLNGTRGLEIAAARSLLGVDLPDPVPGTRPELETRVRCALWFGLHLVLGAVIASLLLVAVPIAVLVLSQQFGVLDADQAGLSGAPVGRGAAAWLLFAVVVLVVTGYVTAGFGALAALMAPVLLGPSATEREQALEIAARRLAERHRLARDLHDSIGHALTLATVQASAAGQVFDDDPQFVRRALLVIEETSRTAMDDLDHVLGVLRDRDVRGDETDRDHDGGTRGPQPTLARLDRLCDDSLARGVPVEVTVTGAVTAVPAVVSREGYRIVQEALTNVARHAGRVPATLRVTVTDAELGIEVVNPLPERASAAGSRAGRGLDGMRERVALLRGTLSTGRSAVGWQVSARLPLAGDR